VRIFKLKAFAKLADKLDIPDASLRDAVTEIEAGKVDASLGAEVYKQRVARRRGGKSGGFRIILVFRQEYRCVFVDVFAKKNKANLSDRELRAIRKAAAELLAPDDQGVASLVESGFWIEVANGEVEV
jgi:hypothetical protein